ncbi:hypothetical protein [Xenorhabdus japonica]|uniref:Uncharacterized protein n=1 Tax=Xenorhabdus japonica TaxID=53341 RepID=A0A1I5C6U5_9GAMM|nr:hypothetical protein [Xenorhabdus japonica]SFN82542.1 hypothetical protein SAMN05421579_12441 [Xenorhabdus japonica]
MKQLAKVLFSLVLILLPFSGHSFQAPDEVTSAHQISAIKIPNIPNTPKIPKLPKTPNKHESSGIKHTYKSIKDAPQYPKGFRPVQNGTTRVVNNKKVLQDLRSVRAGQWYKIYKNGYSASNQRVSIHYFQHKSGLVFDVKVHRGWSIRGS